MKTIVKSDNLFITERLKEIDSSYFVLFNSANSKFELHSSAQLFSTYCLTFPYNTLDERAVLWTIKTLAKNRLKMLEEMEKENQKLLLDEHRKQKERLLANLY